MVVADESTLWLAADYYFPSTYSCRMPLSSLSSARAMPTPGPATVRLALIRIGIELFGESFTRDVLFPVIRHMPVRIRPPEQVALTNQIMRAFKDDLVDQLGDAPIYREVAHTNGSMTVYLGLAERDEQYFRELLNAIGYWGRADSLTYCAAIHNAFPSEKDCIIPLRRVPQFLAVQTMFTCLAADLNTIQIMWDDLTMVSSTDRKDLFELEVYVWPMVTCLQHVGGRLLRRCRIS